MLWRTFLFNLAQKKKKKKKNPPKFLVEQRVKSNEHQAKTNKQRGKINEQGGRSKKFHLEMLYEKQNIQ